jgi:hypothetical protein
MRRTARLSSIALALVAMAACTRKEEKPAVVEEEKPAPYVVPPEPARAAFAPKDATNYTIVGRKSNKCLQFAGTNDSDGANAEIWGCNGSDAQLFTLKPVTGGYFNIVGVRSKKCLDVAGLATNDGAGVQQYTCNGGQNQEWILADGTAGALRIVARHSGKVLDVAGEEIADGTHVNQWGWQSMAHQEFTLVPVPGGKAAKSTPDGGPAGPAARARRRRVSRSRAKRESAATFERCFRSAWAAPRPSGARPPRRFSSRSRRTAGRSRARRRRSP